MADDFVNHVRLGRVQRRRVMTNVLGAEEDSIREVFEKDAWLDQARHRLKAKSADGLNSLVYFAQLWDAIFGKI